MVYHRQHRPEIHRHHVATDITLTYIRTLFRVFFKAQEIKTEISLKHLTLEALLIF